MERPSLYWDGTRVAYDRNWVSVAGAADAPRYQQHQKWLYIQAFPVANGLIKISKTVVLCIGHSFISSFIQPCIKVYTNTCHSSTPHSIYTFGVFNPWATITFHIWLYEYANQYQFLIKRYIFSNFGFEDSRVTDIYRLSQSWCKKIVFKALLGVSNYTSTLKAGTLCFTQNIPRFVPQVIAAWYLTYLFHTWFLENQENRNIEHPKTGPDMFHYWNKDCSSIRRFLDINTK